MINTMKTKNQVHVRVTNFSLYEEGRDPIESGRTYVKEYDTREDKNSIIDNNLILQKNIDRGYRRYCYNLSTRRRMFMVIGTLIGIIVFFFFNLQIPINDYIINQYNLTNEEDYLSCINNNHFE